jgi:signal transduction histidine kinase
MLGDLAAAEEEKMRRIVGLADGISHEFRSPLALLNMGLDSLEASRRQAGGDAPGALLADMRDALTRMGGFVHRLGALSIEHGKTEAEVDVNETIRGLAGVVQLNMRTSGAVLSLDLSPSVAALWLPHQPVTLALFIILNAAAEQVHEAGGSIEVETRMHAEEDAVGIRVAASALVVEEAPLSTLDTSSSGWKDPALDTAARIIQSLGGSMRLCRQAPGAELCAVTLPGAVAPDSTRPDRDPDHSSS